MCVCVCWSGNWRACLVGYPTDACRFQFSQPSHERDELPERVVLLLRGHQGQGVLLQDGAQGGEVGSDTHTFPTGLLATLFFKDKKSCHPDVC